jgi:undecaprenyl-diphosphatase
MEWFQALILGLIQGFTEFLPVSSSGHIERFKSLVGIEAESNLYFTILVHGATVLSTIVVFRKDILQLIKGFFKFKYNEETDYVFKIVVSMIPVAIVGLFFKDFIESFYGGNNIVFVGFMLLITALLLGLTYIRRKKERNINYFDALIIGIAQAFAVLPGISRSGATISTGLMLGNNKSDIAKFSFLMVLIPILGENFLEIFKGDVVSNSSVPLISLVIGFLAAFISGLIACKFMIALVKRGKIYWFAIYCLVAGLLSIFFLS